MRENVQRKQEGVAIEKTQHTMPLVGETLLLVCVVSICQQQCRKQISRRGELILIIIKTKNEQRIIKK